MSVGKASRVETKKWRGMGCPEIKHLLWNTSRTAIIYLLMWGELQPQCLVRNLTGAGTG